MKLSQLQHLLRASAEIVGDKQFIVIGSQSILGKFSRMEKKYGSGLRGKSKAVAEGGSLVLALARQRDSVVPARLLG